jgi:NADH-quinone oxidoreductase subunit H
MPAILLIILKVLVPFLLIFQLLPLLIWLERKGSAYIQDRPGPNRAQIGGVRLGGLVHSIADVLKLLFKEDIIPDHVNRIFYLAAPVIALFVASVTFVVIPFAASIPINTGFFTFQTADINAGILYTLAMTSLGVYGIMLAGWSSNNKFALLGGLRSSAQMISYELSMGIAVLTVVMVTGSLSLNDIAADQSANVLHWNAVRLFPACLVFVVAAFAETNRAPFDLPEGESELVAGYHIEYSSMKFAMFFMAEYVNMIIASAMIVTLFFGGWQIPFASTDLLRANADHILYDSLIGFGALSILLGLLLVSKFKKGYYGDKRDFEVLVLGVPAIGVGLLLLAGVLIHGPFLFTEEVRNIWAALFQIGVFIGKILLFCWVFIWVRWTLPRFRYDQLMTLGWKYMLPTSLVTVFVAAFVMLMMSR